MMLSHLKDQWTSNSQFFGKEVCLFQFFMKREDFVEWYSETPKYKFDLGQEPTDKDLAR